MSRYDDRYIGYQIGKILAAYKDEGSYSKLLLQQMDDFINFGFRAEEAREKRKERIVHGTSKISINKPTERIFKLTGSLERKPVSEDFKVTLYYANLVKVRRFQ